MFSMVAIMLIFSNMCGLNLRWNGTLIHVKFGEIVEKVLSEFSYFESLLITIKDIFCTKNKPSLLF